MKLKAIFLPALLLLAACSSTSIVSSWKDANSKIDPEHLNKVMVIALIKDETLRRVAEDKMATFNKAFQVSYNEFSSKEVMDNEDRCRTILKDQGFDGIITMRLADKQKERTYIPTASSQGYWGYHGQFYSGYYKTGYYQEDTKYIIETRVFSIKQDKLLWAGVTESLTTSVIDANTVSDVMNAVKKQMIKDKFIGE